jgi:hypothetical protein
MPPRWSAIPCSNHRIWWSDQTVATRCCGIGWRGRIRTFDLLIQSQTIRIGLASQSLCSDRRPTPSVLGSVRRTLLRESCALARSQKNQANSIVLDRFYSRRHRRRSSSPRHRGRFRLCCRTGPNIDAPCPAVRWSVVPNAVGRVAHSPRPPWTISGRWQVNRKEGSVTAPRSGSAHRR